MNFINKVNNYLRDITFLNNPEGYSTDKQVNYYNKLITENPQIKKILEIGFNFGMSTSTFLSSRDDIQVVSVDIMLYNYVLSSKQVIDKHFPNRHLLICGDSTNVLPLLKNFFQGQNPDLIFIDGYHEGDYPKKDLENTLKYFCDESTFILIDDWCEKYGEKGVNKAIIDAIKNKELILIDKFECDDRGLGLFKKFKTN
jgi:predicted O-methyltransferase YrrM